MKKFLLLTFYSLLLLINSCEDSLNSIIPIESNFEWAISCAGNSAHGRDIFVDYEGNIYVVGSFSQEVKFDSITIQTNALSGSFLVKFSPDRNLRWIKYVEMPNSIYSVSTDMLGNIVISGKFVVTKMNSDYLLNIEQNSDVMMLNSNGEKIWETNTEGYITNLYIGNNDQIITTSVDYESVIGGNYDDYNYYNKFIISKISNSGSIVFSKEYHSTSTVYAHDIKLNRENEIYITGTFGGTFDLGLTDLVSTSAENFFLMKLDANANCKWAKSYGNQGTVDESDGYSIAVDQNNQIIVYGTFEGNINIEGYQLTTNSSPDMMLCKYTNDGQIVWVHNLTGSPTSRGIMVSDNQNYLYLSNGVSGDIKFKNKTIHSQNSAVVAKLDTEGNLIWAEQASGDYAAFVLGLCVDKNQNAYITGNYQQKITFGNKTLIDDENSTRFFIAKVKNH